MPNGNHWTREEWDAIEGFFARVGPALSQFAAAHGLKIEKYYHDAPSWSLLFRHTSGGVGKIDVERTSDEQLRIWGYWWMDDYKKGIRFLKTEKGVEMPASALKSRFALTETLRMILGWRKDELTPHGGYKDTWHKHWTEEQFGRLDSDYSTPRFE
ncbi:MAG: hypothetical protein OEW06_13835 [Gemmatimonadota bacterium]|nr:hypothetical protein [Gemmatimonadota bacterium]